MYNGFEHFGSFSPFWMPVAGVGLVVVVLWSIFWKGLGLWHAAQRGEQWWFLVMLLINTAGILEIIYLFLILKLKLADLFTKHHHH
jgi:hypothetical protein